MAIKLLKHILLIACALVNTYTKAQSFYNQGTIQKIEVHFSQPNWDYLLDSLKSTTEDYLLADWVKINGTLFDSAGVKYKGNSSYNATNKKNPLHIELDFVKDQNYQGYKDIKLGNGYADPSMLREVLAYDILSNYMDCPKANFAQVYINDQYIGIFSNAESITKKFCQQEFYSNNGTFIKCNPILNPGPTTKSSLRYLNSADSSLYFNYYEIKSKHGWNDLVKLCDTISNNPTGIKNMVDVDRALWMLAFNNVLVNLDSYSGVFCQNYYLYKIPSGHFAPIVWDLNMSFGGFPYMGSGATAMGSLTVSNMQQLPLTIHNTDTYWPLIKNLLSINSYYKMYLAHVKTIYNEFFSNNLYQAKANNYQNLIDSAVAQDSNLFFSYTQFRNALTTNYVNGSYTIPGISTLMENRKSYLNATTDFNKIPPSISQIKVNTTTIVTGAAIHVTAKLSQCTSAYLAYRNSIENAFTKIPMLDDGLHQDGLAGDSIYGAAFILTNNNAQYYLYAENNNAGIFSPERAEHEFYTLNAIPDVEPNQLHLNEFLAINSTLQTNLYGTRSDWIELYNSASTALDLSNCFLSDDYDKPFKFRFPANTIIQPDSFLIVWADSLVSNSAELHCGYSLSNNGEKLILSYISGQVLDSVDFSTQTVDVSFGRCPDGNGTFRSYTTPSFNSANCFAGLGENNTALNLRFYPNPANTTLNFINPQPTKKDVIIYTLPGQEILRLEIQDYYKLPIDQWPNGFYLIKCGELTQRLIIQH